ncbi:MAG: diacylglycerol kinase family protein [Polyangia bacterium]|jgi:diacylglycerol kinase family enzyme|nr:diacylglycerol kinase family protein [Polyangia bacterium]
MPSPTTAGTEGDRSPKGEGGQRKILLLCNVRAGGRWKELATILDSPEAKHVRWIVTDSIEDIGPALASMGDDTELLCVYGGDGTIQRVIEQLFADRDTGPTMAFIGGGTMNVTAGWCGWGRSPGKNFRQVVQAYRAGRLLTKEVPLLAVEQNGSRRFGFIFGLGPIIRVLNEYENGRKGALAALEVLFGALGSAMARLPGSHFHRMLDPLVATVRRDGEALPYSQFSILFANTTGKLHIGVQPFVKKRTRETFYMAAYAITKQEVALLLPMLARGRLPIDPKSLIAPISTWKHLGLSLIGQEVFHADPRYVNDLASVMEIETAEPFYTVDAEIIPNTSGPIRVSLGPYLRLVVHPTVDLPATVRLAAGVAQPPVRGE